MPRPPILPTIDWKAVLESGAGFDKWLEQAENAEHRARMEAATKTLILDPSRESLLAELPRTVNVVVIAEDWCGDVVRFVPVLMRMARAAASKLNARFITRAQHADVFARFLTNGGEAIPKFIFISDALVECGSWGPMPAECRRIMSRGKGAGDIGAARERVSKLYESDPHCEAAVRELLELIDTATCARP